MNRVTLILLLVLVISCTSRHNINDIQNKQECQHENIVSRDSLKFDDDCNELEKYVLASNWRKHSSNRCYVVDRSIGFGFITSVYRFKECGRILSYPQLIDIFGKPIDTKISAEGIKCLIYPFVVNESIAIYEQDMALFTICIIDNDYVFFNEYEVGHYPVEPIVD